MSLTAGWSLPRVDWLIASKVLIARAWTAADDDAAGGEEAGGLEPPPLPPVPPFLAIRTAAVAPAATASTRTATPAPRSSLRDRLAGGCGGCCHPLMGWPAGC